MAYRNWLGLLAIAGLMACGGSRDRAPGTTNNNNGTLHDAGVSTGDAGTSATQDGGTTEIPTSLDRNTDIGALSPSELAELCELAVENTDFPPTTCGEGLTVEQFDYDACISGDAPAGCSVGEFLDCLASLDGDPCNFFQTQQCLVLFGCGL